MQRFTLVYRPFPAECGGNIHGVTISTGGRLKIFIDSAQDEQTQRSALRHELAHIVCGHFTDTARNLRQLEAEADEYAARMTDSEIAELIKGAIA